MKRAASLAVLLLVSGCASWRAPAPGPTEEGLAVAVRARDKAAARREALESLLPLYLTEAARSGPAASAVEKVLSQPAPLVARERHPEKGPGVVEVRVDALSAALRKTGAVVPPGYEGGPEVVLIAFGDRAAPREGRDKLSADALEVALFGRGIQAKDADDELSPIPRPLKSKTEAGLAEEAAGQGWAWLAAGRVETAARREPVSAAWRAKARLTVSLYALASSTQATSLEASGESLDVSSASAVTRAVEQAAQEAALRVERAQRARRGGRATLAVLISGRKDPRYLARVVSDLRRSPGVEGAALTQWRSLDDMALIHAYARGVKAEELAARLLHDDASLRVAAIETEDGRLTLEGPEIPESEDRGN